MIVNDRAVIRVCADIMAVSVDGTVVAVVAVSAGCDA
jgi:hypothetical protein